MKRETSQIRDSVGLDARFYGISGGDEKPITNRLRRQILGKEIRGNSQPEHLYTLDEYLDFEETAAEKHEFEENIREAYF
ncbi:MAG TPA: hypothetical protein VJ302_14435 [Blastocatellia bacterium]|nr:hypothetical protein [Blastocatellia bacterium]